MKAASQLLPTAPKNVPAEVFELCARMAGFEHDLTAQRQQLEEREQTLHVREQRIEQLLDEIQLLRQKRFSNDCDHASKHQIHLINEAELEALIAALEAQIPTTVEQNRATPIGETEKLANKLVQRPLPAYLERIDKIIDSSTVEKAAMGDDWVLIGYDDSEQLATIPRQ